MIGVSRFKFYVDRPGVRRRVGRKQHVIFSRTGAYGRGAMKKQMRPQLKQKGQRTVQLTVTRNGRLGQFTKQITVFVDRNGPVVDVSNGFPVTREEADEARKIAYARIKGQGEGKPPRVGPTRKLRSNIDFGIDPKTESVVIGAYPFPNQPSLAGRVTVPELLDKGGGEVISGQLVKFGERPFTKPILPIAQRKMAELIEKTPL